MARFLNPRVLHQPVFLLLGLVWALALTVARAQAPYRPGVAFPIVWITVGQSARVNALNLGTASSTKDSGCGVMLQFLDAQGQVVKQKFAVLQAGEGVSQELSRSELLGQAARAPLRTVVLFGYHGGPNPGPGVLQHFDCNILPSLEVYDDNTGKTTFAVTDVEPLPAPSTPAQ